MRRRSGEAVLRNVIVTGGAGIKGSTLTRHLIGHVDWQVTIIDKLTSAVSLSSINEISNQNRYRFIKADTVDRKAIDQTLAEVRLDAIMHLAAKPLVDRSIRTPPHSSRPVSQSCVAGIKQFELNPDLDVYL